MERCFVEHSFSISGWIVGRFLGPLLAKKNSERLLFNFPESNPKCNNNNYLLILIRLLNSQANMKVWSLFHQMLIDRTGSVLLQASTEWLECFWIWNSNDNDNDKLLSRYLLVPSYLETFAQPVLITRMFSDDIGIQNRFPPGLGSTVSNDWSFGTIVFICSRRIHS